MTLHYDYARCAGTTHPTCKLCRRREPGHEHWQNCIAPPIDTLGGECCSFIGPRAYARNNTASDVRDDTAQPGSLGIVRVARPVRRRLVCLHCGAPEDEHCEFEPKMPDGCQCAPGEWGEYVLDVCKSFAGAPGGICSTCEHDEACHGASNAELTGLGRNRSNDER